MQVSSSAVGRPRNQGMFEGFEAYRTPTPDDYRAALQTSLVVFDTNVLLNLYRYNETTRQSVVDVVQALEDRFWVPHQVLEEFWRNRERALASPLAEIGHSLSNLDKQLAAAREDIHMWVNRGALSSDLAAPVEDQLERAFSVSQDLLGNLIDADDVQRARNTQHDHVLALLAPVLEGRVGPPMDDQTYAKALIEGKKRAANGEPPGFADAKKAEQSSEGAAGDYLVWEQTLVEAEQRGLDVVFVTGDVKKDWWRYEGSFARGPRLELTREMRRRCGKSLLMMRPDVLLGFADALSVSVQPASVAYVERATRTDEHTPGADIGEEATWNRAALDLVLRRLSVQAPVQAACIRAAASAGGYIGREEVYRIGEYEPERQLKGFTRPVNRLVQKLRDTGELAEEAPDLLQPVYADMEYGFGWVDGFQVPPDAVGLLNATQEEHP